MIDTREQYTGREVETSASEAGVQGSDSLGVRANKSVVVSDHVTPTSHWANCVQASVRAMKRRSGSEITSTAPVFCGLAFVVV
jgi:hypothetical protein